MNKKFRKALQEATSKVADKIQNEAKFKSDLMELKSLILVNNFVEGEEFYIITFQRVKDSILKNAIIDLPEYSELKTWLMTIGSNEKDGSMLEKFLN